MLFRTAACLKAFGGKEEGALCDAKCDKTPTAAELLGRE